MKCMFNECYKLKEIKGIEIFNTYKLMDIEGIFQSCINLEYLGLKKKTKTLYSISKIAQNY